MSEIELYPGYGITIEHLCVPHMEAVGEQMEAIARRYVPVDTGTLRNSIGHEVDYEDGTVTLYADAPYAEAVEFGHITASGSFVPPRPFLRPAIEQELGDIAGAGAE